MAKRTKDEIEKAKLGINFSPMNVKGDEMFKRSNNAWGTEAFNIRRSSLENQSIQFGDKELFSYGIYFLIGNIDGVEKIYVGKSANVIDRLRAHVFRPTDSERQYYYEVWDRAIAITSTNDSWGETEVKALEAIMIQEVPDENSLNSKDESIGDIADKYDEVIRQIELYLASCSVRTFDDVEGAEDIASIYVPNEHSTTEDIQNGMARIPEFTTPKKVVKQMVDMLPADVWNDQTVFLDPACKGGEFLREIYDRLMDNEYMKAKYPTIIARSNHILTEQLYGIAISTVSKERATNTLDGFGMNIRVIPNYINNLKGIDMGSRPDGSHNNIRDILNKEFGKTMNIDVVIGNPPYQEGNQSIYPRFIEMAMDTSSNKVLMITKNNWITGNTLSKTRNRMIRFGLKNIINYPLVREVFTGVSVAVGIFDMQKGYDGETHYTEIQNGKTINDISTTLIEDKPLIFEKNQLSIINKIISRKDFRPYDLAKNARMWSIASNGFFMHADYTEDCIDYSFNREKDDDIEVIFMNSAHELYKMFTDRSELPKGEEFVDTYKIVCGSKAASNNTVLTNINALNPGQIITNSFGIIGISKDKATAYALYQYAKTKFQRFLIKLAVSGDRVTYGVGCTCYVPLLNFANNNDIDWSQPIGITSTPQEIISDIGKDLKDCKDKSIDAQLYRKYNLSDEEIAYIEKEIKTLD